MSQKLFRTTTRRGITYTETLGGTVNLGWRNSIFNCERELSEMIDLCDALELGETLVDEDGDTWERIA